MPITINGDGSITGLAVGGLPDGCVDADTLAAGAAVPADGSITAAKLASGAITSSILPAGTPIQVVNHITTTRLNTNVSGQSSVTATSGGQFTAFNFTPKLASSKLLLTSSTFVFGEGSNTSDAYVAFATHGGDTIIGTVCNYSGYDHWASSHDTAFVSFNHLFDSWGTSQKAISIRVQSNGGNPTMRVNYPTGQNTYASQFNSPNRHQVTFTMTEFRA